MPLQATSGAASYDAFGGGVAAVPNYIEDVFSTYLYTGNGSTQTINNGIDLAGKGGLTWIKRRSFTNPHALYDTNRGATSELSSNTTGAAFTNSNGLTAFNASGFSIGPSATVNLSDEPYVSWTFREQPKFFDVVTWTATSTTNTNLRVSHNLGSVPGCIFIKATSTTDSWYVYHRELGINQYVRLNATSAAATNTPSWGTSNPTSTDFGFNENLFVASAPTTFVAYVFAHNAGGFGLTGTDNVISCGSFTTSGTGDPNAIINLGYEPQWVMLKKTNSTGNWIMYDTMRGLPVQGATSYALYANLANAEGGNNAVKVTSVGFNADTGSDAETYIYIAIRRGPMKVPTTGTSVFAPIVRTGTGADVTVTGAGFAPDLVATANRDTNGFGYYDKLRGALRALRPSQTSAEATYTTTLTGFTNNGYTAGSNSDGFGEINGNTDPFVNHMFRRAPGFFDEVCYTGDYANNPQIAHNLGVPPELLITKNRGATATQWYIKHSGMADNKEIYFNANAASIGPTWVRTSTYWQYASAQYPTGEPHVAYLFASCPGVSKVGSYTGTGTTLQVNCGFTAGARFVLIKRTDSTGDWYVWDSARGIVAGNDPYLLLNSTAAEVTSTDYVDTYSAGFEISSTAPAAINASGGTFIYLAIA